MFNTTFYNISDFIVLVSLLAIERAMDTIKQMRHFHEL